MPEYIQYDSLTGRIIQKWYSVDPSTVKGLANILEVPRDVYNSLTKYWIVDNGILREMTQTEKDKFDLEEQQRQEQAKLERIKSFDDEIENLLVVDLPKIDSTIDNIRSLEDAKTFLKKLCRYIIKLIVR